MIRGAIASAAVASNSYQFLGGMAMPVRVFIPDQDRRYPINEGEGTVIRDIKSGEDGTLTSAAGWQED